MSSDLQRSTASAWTYVVTRACAERIVARRSGEGWMSFLATIRDSEASPNDSFLRAIVACLDGLAPQQRAVLIADLDAGGSASVPNLASRLGTTPNSIYVSRNQGRRALHIELLRRGHGPGYASG